MGAGKYRHSLILQASTTTQNARGADVHSWVDVATIRGNVRTPNGRERTANEQTVAVLTHIVEIRYRSDVTPLHRFKWGDRVFSLIAAPDPDNRRRELICQCQETVGDTEVI